MIRMLVMGFVFLFFRFTLSALTLDRVILSTNNNPDYVQFWPIVAKLWASMGVKPTLAFIATPDIVIDDSLGDVIRFEPIMGVAESLQAQVVRLLLPSYFPNDTCIISDIDMLPLNKNYFFDKIKNLSDDVFVVYRNLAYGDKNLRFPMCYVAAKGFVFQEIFHIKNRNNISLIIKNWSRLGFGWDTDEVLLHRYLTCWGKYFNKCVFLNQGILPRIDRAAWMYDTTLLENGFYIDAHCPRPYLKYKESIDLMVEKLIYSGNL